MLAENSEMKSKEECENLEGLRMEYSAIRDEIILLMNEHNTHITNLFLISTTLLGIGYQFKNPWLFIIVYLVAIPFQTLINNKQYMLIRCGVYISIYIEPRIEGLRWERTVHDVDKIFKERYKLKFFNVNIEDELCDFGAFIFSLVALISYTYYSFFIESGSIPIQNSLIGGEVFAVVSTIIVFFLCNKGSKFEIIYNECSEIIKNL